MSAVSQHNYPVYNPQMELVWLLSLITVYQGVPKDTILLVINITITTEVSRQIPDFGQMSDLFVKMTRGIIVIALMKVKSASMVKRTHMPLLAIIHLIKRGAKSRIGYTSISLADSTNCSLLKLCYVKSVPWPDFSPWAQIPSN